jgi:hypothetical protein
MKNNKLTKTNTRAVLLCYIAVKEAAQFGWPAGPTNNEPHALTPHEYATQAAVRLFIGLCKHHVEPIEARTEVLREAMLAGLWFPQVRIVQSTGEE